MSSVQTIINTAQSRTDSAVSDAGAYVNILRNISESWTSYTHNWDYTNTEAAHSDEVIKNLISNYAPIDNGKSYIDEDTIKVFDTTDSRAVAASAIPLTVKTNEMQRHGIEDLEPLNIQDANIGMKPEYVRPDRPDTAISTPAITTNIQDSEAVTTSIRHEANSISEPDKINVEEYRIPAPDLNYTVPTNDFSFVEQDYSSEFRQSILGVLLDDVENGGLGIHTGDEKALFDRAVDREAGAYQEAHGATMRSFAARGFRLPPGAAAALLNKNNEQFNQKKSSINRDIMLQRSELHLQARQFAIQAGTTLDNALLSYHGSVMERALNVSRLSADFGIQFHNLKVKQFEDLINRWRSISDVKSQWIDNAVKATKEYELKLQKMNLVNQNNQTRTDLMQATKEYELKLQKMNLVNQNNQTRTDLMQAMNQAVEVAENVRRTEIQIAELEIKKNQLLLETSKQNTQNYLAFLEGNSNEFDAYVQYVKAENSRNDPNALRIEAHKEYRATIKDRHDRDFEHKKTQIAIMEANLKRSQQYVQGYLAELDHTVNAANTKARLLGVDLSVWETKLKAEQINQSNQLEADKFNISSDFERIKTNIQGKELEFNNWLSVNDGKVKASNSVLELYTNIISSAQNALGTIATIAE